MATDQVTSHYGSNGNIAETIAARLHREGKQLEQLTTGDLAPVDEFHIRGREATLQLAEKMNLSADSRVLDIGSGLGGPARTIAEQYGCQVTGIDVTETFCDAAQVLSGWVHLDDKVSFKCADAIDLPFSEDEFDAVMTIHAGMNIADKARMYQEARRVIKPGGTFAVYDVLQGEGGEVLYPVPWARQPPISYLATPGEMEAFLIGAGFKPVDVVDSTEESEAWFEKMAIRIAEQGPSPLSLQVLLGEDFSVMAHNQARNLAEKRVRTISYICRA